MTDQVEALWSGIVTWLHREAPATAGQLRPPATEAVIGEATRQLGRSLPDDLLQWWGLADGLAPSAMDPLIPPLYTPVPVADALRIRQDWLRLMRSEPEHDEPGEAGSPSHRFHDLFLPIAVDHCGQAMFVDLRDGRWHGCIGVWDHESAWDNAVYWESVTDMLTDIRDGLINRKPALVAYAGRRLRRFAGYQVEASIWRASVTDGEVEWTDHPIHSRS
jgi:cell wall assembly regulator SMI1